MIRVLPFAIACLFVFANTNAQVIDKKAEEILEQLSGKIQDYKNMHIEFTYLMENVAENIKESKTGSIYIQGDKFRLYIADQIIISDGKNVWTYFKNGNEVQINEVDADDENTPMKMLTGYNKNYRPKLIGEASKTGKLIQTIDLIPNTTQSFYKIRIEIDKAKNMIHSSTIYDKNGTTFSYNVDNFRENINIHPSRFAFRESDYPGVEVIDMR